MEFDRTIKQKMTEVGLKKWKHIENILKLDWKVKSAREREREESQR